MQQKVPQRPTYAARAGAGQKAGGMQAPRHGGYGGGDGQQGHGAYGARPRYSEAAKVYNKRAGGHAAHKQAPAYGQRAQAGHGHGQYHRARPYQARAQRAYRGW